jgi:hypothetical protein
MKTHLATVGILTFLIVSCGNPYRSSYLSTLNRQGSWQQSAILPPSGPPRLVTSEDMESDTQRMRENGYLLLGRSQFQSATVDEKQALAQAKTVGAEVVMVNRRFASRVTESVPMTEWIPGQRTDQTEQVVILEEDKKPKVVQRTTTTEVQGEFRTTYVDQSVSYFEFAATYWARMKPPAFGVNVKELSHDAKVELGTNKGVQVRVVLKGSPAYDADLLKDDIILTVNGEDVTDPRGFFALVNKNKGKTVPVTVYRRGQLSTFRVDIRN